MSIKSIVALALLAFTVPTTAGTVTVHNQGHYLVAFQVSEEVHDNGLLTGQSRTQDSGVFPIGQSRTIRTMKNVFWTFELKMRRMFTWSIFNRFNSGDPELFEAGKPTLFNVNDDSNIEVTFMGDVFNPRIIINGNVLDIGNVLE
ncbi:MAG: hypothetical protein EPN17_14045 [Methylobacter sp.]|nr:MAG: hypothetical protein EPN17_14045 [Methylobacter sp.]